MHEANEVSEGGLPLLHTTSLTTRRQCPMVRPLNRGIVSGPAILLPRVGFPRREHLTPMNLAEHQLSDCVIALSCLSEVAAVDVSQRMGEHFDRVRECWQGTGAPYTTLKRLRGCLVRLGIGAHIGQGMKRAAGRQRERSGGRGRGSGGVAGGRRRSESQ